MIGWLWGVAHAEGVDEQVARGWYLWRTGQDAAAADVARSAVAAEPADLAAIELHTAMEVVAGNGFSVESAYRESWGDSPADPVRRVALAMAIALRHAPVAPGDKPGAWCDEVAGLVDAVATGEEHYWATRADRQRELRCTGQTGHADAELRRLAKDPAGEGWADGVLARLGAGYIKEDLPPDLERLWTEQPFHLDAAAVLWEDGTAGPARNQARKVAKRALDAALAADDPVAVHAALVAYTVSEQEREAEEAAARLGALDPAAKTDLVRTLEDVADPATYATIDRCTAGFDLDAQLECIQDLALPEAGSIAAYAHYVRRMLFEAKRDDDGAYAEAKAAWEADRAHRFDARAFARLAAARKVDLDLALEAVGVVLAGRVPATGTAVPRPAELAKDLELQVDILRGLGRAAEAVGPIRLAQAIEPTPARQLLVGIVLAESGGGDEAALALSYALLAPIEDTARVSAGRDLLGKLGWLGTAQGMVDAAGRDPAEKGPAHPLLGAKITDAASLPTPPAPPEGAKKPPPPGIRVIATWANWRPDSVEALERLAGVAKRYADKSVTVVALGVDATDQAPQPPPEVLPPPKPGAPPPAAPPAAPTLDIEGLEIRHAGPGAMRALKSVALPTVVVVDGKGVVVAVLSPWDRGSLGLENALDPLLPDP